MILNIQYLENYNKKWGLISSKEGDSGYDLRAAIKEQIVLAPGERKVVPNGIKIQLDTTEWNTCLIDKELNIPVYRLGGKYDKDSLVTQLQKERDFSLEDFNKTFSFEYERVNNIGSNVEIQVRPRSGLAAKNGITVVNAPGTVDYSYRGEVMTILLNTGGEEFVINPGDRIAQMVICPIYKPEVVEVKDVEETDRNVNGFGSSGVK